MLETDCLTVDGDSCADFALRVTDDECEPYIARGGTAYIQRGAVISDGDVGLFFDGHRAVIRQYCEDWAGNAHLLTLNRRRAGGDILLPAGEGRPVCCFGRVLLDREVPLPRR